MKILKALPLALLLCLCMCLLAACGSGENQSTADPETEIAAAADELVYTAQYREIPLDRDKNLQPLCLSEDGLYAQSWEEQENPEAAEGEPTVKYVQKLYYVNRKGQMIELTTLESPASEGQEKLRDYNAGCNLQGIFPQENGELLAVESVFASWFDGPENVSVEDPNYWNYYKNENSYRLLRMDSQGGILSQTKLEWDSDAGNSDWLDFNSAILDGEGRLIVTGQQSVYVFSSNGSLSGNIELEDWPSGVVLLADGRSAVVLGSPRGTQLMILDLENMQLGESMDLEQWPYKSYTGAGDYACFYVSGTRLYGVKQADGSNVEILNLLDCELTAETLLFLQAKEDGSFRASSGENGVYSLVDISQVPRSSLPEKRELVLGTMGDPDSVLSQVLRFNRSHEDIRIKVVDYSESFDYESSDVDPFTKLSTEILTGSMPDLLCLDGLPYEQFAAKGLLEDLSPWLDQDGELKRTDFLPSVLKAQEFNGGLYQIASGFQVYTVIGASSVVGEEPGLSISQMQEALASMPEGCTLFGPSMSRDEMLVRCLYVDMDSYVNWSTGSCDFDNEDFCELLNFCSTFPARADYNAGSDYGRAATGQQMLLEEYISSLEEMGYADQYFGGKITYVGFPTRTGSGSILVLNNAFGMSATCSDKAAAWDFLRSFLTADYQRSQYNLPLRHDVFDEQMADAMRIEYEMDENGQPRLDENGEKIPISRGGMGTAGEDGEMFSFEFYGLTREQADRFLAMLEIAQPFPSFNNTIFEMVQNEAAPFFAGERSAEDTAKLIQSKVSLYLAEQH